MDNPTTPRVMREAAMCPAVAYWLMSMQMRVYTEILWYHSAIDVIGINRNSKHLVCVEMKTTLNKKVRQQALLNQLLTVDSYAIVSTYPRRSTLKECERMGIGVGVARDGLIDVVLAPIKRMDPIEGHYASLLERLREWPEGGVGGLPQLKGEGPAIDCAARVKEWLATQTGKVTWKMVYANVPNHYSSAASMAGKMLMKGICLEAAAVAPRE